MCSFIIMGKTKDHSIDNPAQSLDAEVKGKIIEEIAQLIEEKYVFPDVAEKIAGYIRKRNKEKSYESITNLHRFIEEITKDLGSINNDAHLGLVLRRQALKGGDAQEEMYKAFFLKRALFQNYGFKKAERLLGNVGCIVIDEFSYIEMDGENVGGDTAKAVMKMISNCYALIIDLRDNFGGREEMALLLLDYFFLEPTHILTNQYRDREDNQIWTKGMYKVGRLAEMPLYILTSQHTVSGGEMFAYVLKNRGRAAIIGENTRGAAHKTHLFSLQSAKIDIAIPVGTTIDPITGEDWEGKGVEPDISVSSGKALDMAYKTALESIMQKDVDRTEKSEMEWTLMEVEANLNPIKINQSLLKEYVGVFGERKIYLENSTLIYQWGNRTAYELEPMSRDLFSFVDKGMFYVRIQFNRDKSGVVDKIILLYDTGQKREYKKTGD